MHKQSLLPGFPEGSHKIGVALSILEKDGRVTYFVGGDNYWLCPHIIDTILDMPAAQQKSIDDLLLLQPSQESLA